jgi:hypothetical protein
MSAAATPDLTRPSTPMAVEERVNAFELIVQLRQGFWQRVVELATLVQASAEYPNLVDPVSDLWRVLRARAGGCHSAVERSDVVLTEVAGDSCSPASG